MQKKLQMSSHYLLDDPRICIKSLKMCIKSDFKEIILNLATNGQSDKGCMLTSTFVPKGLFAPALVLYTCIKALKYIP